MRKFKRVLAIVALVVIANSSCSKEELQEVREDLAVSIMTNGDWIITKFSERDYDITSLFTGWQCHFNTDKTCKATKGSEEVLGTWNASASSKTITGLFPANSEPLSKINGTWRIVRTTASYGEFTQVKNGITYKMELTKK